VRSRNIVAQGDVQAVNIREIAHQALIEFSIHGDEPGLRARAETPLQRHRERARAIGNAVDALRARGDHRVGIPAAAKGQPGMSLQYRICARHLHRLRHERGGLAGCFTTVASSAPG